MGGCRTNFHQREGETITLSTRTGQLVDRVVLKTCRRELWPNPTQATGKSAAGNAGRRQQRPRRRHGPLLRS